MKLTSLWKDGLALGGEDQEVRKTVAYGQWAGVIAKSVLLTLGADLDLNEDRIWERCMYLQSFFLWGFESWVCGRKITSTITTAAKTPLLARSKQLLQTSWLEAFRNCLVSTGISSLYPTASVGQSLLWPHVSALFVLRQALAQDSWPAWPATFAASWFWSPFNCAWVTAVPPRRPRPLPPAKNHHSW